MDPIDELYKKSFEEFKAPYNEQAWQSMQNALKPVKGPFHGIKTRLFKWYAIVPTTALVTVVAVWAVITFNNDKVKTVIRQTEPIVKESITSNNASSNKITIKNSSNKQENTNTGTNVVTENLSANENRVNVNRNNTAKNNNKSLSKSEDAQFAHSRKGLNYSGTLSTQVNSSGSKEIIGAVHESAERVKSDHSTITSTNNLQAQDPLAGDKAMQNNVSKDNSVSPLLLNADLTSIRLLSFSLGSIKVPNTLNDRTHFYKSMPLPGVVSRYEIEIKAGLQNISSANGYHATAGNEQMVSFAVLQGHISYSIGIGRYAFNMSLTNTVDSTYASQLKVPKIDTIYIPQVFKHYWNHKWYYDTLYEQKQVAGYKDSTAYKKMLLTKHISSNLRFIEIPLNIGYRYNIQKGFAEVQASASFLLNQSAPYNYYYSDGSYTKVKPFNAFTLSGIFKAGYNITNHVGAFGYYQYRYASTFSSLPTGDKLKWTSNSAGLGLFYRF